MPYSEQQKADLSISRGKASALIADPNERKTFISKQGDQERTAGGTLPDEQYAGLQKEADDTQALLQGNKPSYRKGTNFVKRTGPAILHRGEAVLTKKKATAMRKRKRGAFFGE